MKRLTNQKWSDDIDLTQELGYKYIYQKLYEFENKLADGRMVELPCKIGDKLHSICEPIVEYIVDNISIADDGVSIWLHSENVSKCICADDIGKTVFPTFEQALKEMEDK